MFSHIKVHVLATRLKTSLLIAELKSPSESTGKSGKRAQLQEMVKQLGKVGKAGQLREFIYAEREALEKSNRGDDEEKTDLSSGEVRKMLERISILGSAPPDIQNFIQAVLELESRDIKELIEELGSLSRARVFQEFVRGALRVSEET